MSKNRSRSVKHRKKYGEQIPAGSQPRKPGIFVKLTKSESMSSQISLIGCLTFNYDSIGYKRKTRGVKK